MVTEWGSNLAKATQQLHGTALELGGRLGPKKAGLSFAALLLSFPGETCVSPEIHPSLNQQPRLTMPLQPTGHQF